MALNTSLVSKSVTLFVFGLFHCNVISGQAVETKVMSNGKPVIYQVFTRLYGNKNTTNKPWGTKFENGVGKFSDFTDKALTDIKSLGVTHIWFTGVLHHNLIGDYQEYGIKNDDPDVVKGRAGSPYAIKDYYNVNPDLATHVENRLAEFEALIQRTHQHGMKVIIDIVPNHIARNYKSVSKPQGVSDFGAKDKTNLQYDKNNNFYYIIGENFKVPTPKHGYKPLGGESHAKSDGIFIESPAKWTGNGSRKSQPDFNDWYETVKVNYGIKPNGQKDFPTLPDGYGDLTYHAHHTFWQDKQLPDSWYKFNDITQYWLNKGVDGFRYDMAEMVPVEFWSYLNSAIKTTNPKAAIIAEVYDPARYRNFIRLGKMDYLYDKVDFYDSVKDVMQGKSPAVAILKAQHKVLDIEKHMLHFLENHDEQRIASPEFAGDAKKGMPAMLVSTLISRSPTMLYFGQDLGEVAGENAGFGKASRTSIFDYIGVPSHQRWMNSGAFDGGQSLPEEKQLRQFYVKLMKLSQLTSVANGEYSALSVQTEHANDSESVLAFSRWHNKEKLIVISQFGENVIEASAQIPPSLIKQWATPDGEYIVTDLLSGREYTLIVKDSIGKVKVRLAALGSFVFRWSDNQEI